MDACNLYNELEQYGFKIEPIAYTFIIPLNLYSHKVNSLSELKDGDVMLLENTSAREARALLSSGSFLVSPFSNRVFSSSITSPFFSAIPDDVTNGGRAIKVLAAAGLITLRADADFNPTLDDIETYNVGIEIKELKANTIPSVLEDVTAAIINGNYALDFGLKTEEAIYKDDVLDEEKYWNLVAARTADLSDPAKVETYKKVVAAFQSDATEKVFNETFGGYFIKVGWDQDLLASR